MKISYLVDTRVWGESAILIGKTFCYASMFPQQIFCLSTAFVCSGCSFFVSPPPSIPDFTDSSASAAFLSHQLPKQHHHHQCLDSMGGFILLLPLLLRADATPSKQHCPIRSKLSKTPSRLNFHRLPAQMNFIFTSFTSLSGLLRTE